MENKKLKNKNKMFFHKNKRVPAFCTKRTVFCVLFLVATLSISGVASLILNANAQLAPVRTIELNSENASFENADPGAWKVTKSAEWTGIKKARITFDIDSIVKDDGKHKDVMLVIDNPSSVQGYALSQIRSSAIDLANHVLADPDNRMGLITFTSRASVLFPLSNDRETITDIMSGIVTGESVDFYQGLQKAQEELSNYENSNDRQLILLYAVHSDFCSNMADSTLLYRILKAQHPNMTINIAMLSSNCDTREIQTDYFDNLFYTNYSDLSETFREAILTPYSYNEFKITDYLNEEYWNINSIDSINATSGEVALEYDGAKPKIIWNLESNYYSGRTETLTIDIEPTIELSNEIDILMPTNTSETVSSKMKDLPDELVSSEMTPVLRSTYSASYDVNSPSDCEVIGTVPAAQRYLIHSTVGIDDINLQCQGYSFNGWQINTQNAKYINDDYFLMSEEDVVLMATWGKPSIAKSMSGESHSRASATFDIGTNVNKKMKQLSGQADATDSTNNTTITRIAKSESLPSTINILDENYILSAADSPVPIYGWYNNGTLYYYSDADDLFLNKNSSRMFMRLAALTDISCLATLNTSRVTEFTLTFQETALTNVDALADWDVSSVTRMTQMFYTMKYLQNVDGLSRWNTASLTNMDYIFRGDNNLTNIDGLSNWNISRVASLTYIFAGVSSLTSLDALAGWDTSNITGMQAAFMGTSSLTDISALANWNTNSLNYLVETFSGSTSLTDISPISGWDTSRVTSMSRLFHGASSITDISPISGWNTSSLKNMSGMLYGLTSLVNANPLKNWDTSKVEDFNNMFANDSALTTINELTGLVKASAKNLNSMFSGASSLVDISSLSGWDTSGVTNMSNLFQNARSIVNANSLKNWNTVNVTTFYSMFSGAQSLTDISELTNLVKASAQNLGSMFSGASSLVDISSLSEWDTSGVTNTSYMFRATKVANASPIGVWNTGSLTDMRYMFNQNRSLTNISGLVNWDTSNVVYMDGVFSGANSVTDFSALAGWETPSVQKLSYLFFDTGITNLDAISGWDVSNLIDMSHIFNTAKLLTDIEGIRNWNTSSATSMAGMFSSASMITDIEPISGWDTSKVTNISKMFYNASGITNFSTLNGWDTSRIVDKADAFTGANSSAPPSWY